MQTSNRLKHKISHLPETPGIYIFFDEKGRLLYIGKSKNLKSRVRTYFRKQSGETQERTLIMIGNIAEIRTIETGTELEALIMEDSLIKKHLPPYNVKQKRFKEQVYIAITSDVFPAFKIIKNDQIDFTEKIFGPFKDKYAAEHILLVLQKILKLRKCNDHVPNQQCILAGIGKCLSPCTGNIAFAEYQQIVNKAVDFLSGNELPISQTIDQQIVRSASNLEFEEAAKLRDLKEFTINFCQRQRFMQDFIHKNLVIQKGRFSFIFRRGDLIKVYKQKMLEDQIEKISANSENIEVENVHHLMDRAYVVWVWVKQNKAKYQIIA